MVDAALSSGNEMASISAIIKLLASWGGIYERLAKSAPCSKREGPCGLCGVLSRRGSSLKQGCVS